MARQSGDVALQAHAGPQPPQDASAPGRRPARRGPGKPTRPPGELHARRGLAASCSSAPKRSAARAGELVRQRLGQERASAVGAAPSPRTAAGSRSSVDGRLQHLERVAVHVAVVIGALLDAVHRGELRQHDLGQRQVVQQDEAADGRLGHEEPAELGEDPLRRHAAPARAPPRGPRRPSGARRRSRARPRAARGAARAAGRRANASGATIRRRRAARSSAPPSGSTSAPPSSGSAIALTVRSRTARSARSVSPCSGDEVDLPGCAGPTTARPRRTPTARRRRRRVARASALAGRAPGRRRS